MLKIILFAVMALLVWAAISDFRIRKIPNWISLGIILLFLGFLGAQFYLEVTPPILPVIPSLITGFAVLIVFSILFHFGFIGGGDVKLITALGFWTGPAQIVSFLVIMAVTGGVIAFFYILKETWGPQVVRESDNKISKKAPKNNKNQVKSSHKKYKDANIPYGIAISVGGLFAVNQLLTFLTA